MDRVLIVTYYWPPGSGAGVQRWLKFAKYLPQAGWEPVILTVDPQYATYPASDHSLLKDISPDLRVITTKATDWFRFYAGDKKKIPSAGFAKNGDNSLKGKLYRFIRGNFFIPDPRRGWNRHALKAASAIIEKEGIRHVITTSPPHSSQLIGLALKEKYPFITWIADLRDPWTHIYYYNSFFHTPPAKMLDKKLEKEVLQQADRLITVGESLIEDFCNIMPGIDKKTFVLPNGYDDDDFSTVTSEQPDIFTICYTGTLSDAYPLSGFLKAVDSIAGKGIEIKLRFVGTLSPGSKELIKAEAKNTLTEFIPYVSHEEAISYMVRASLNLLIIPDHPSNKSIITGKLFEYLASGRPVLCIGPPKGDAARIIETAGQGRCAGYDDQVTIGQIIEQYRQGRTHSLPVRPSAFSRKTLTVALASLLNSCHAS